ncbi:hypothetical protein ACFPT7_15440 [Acidicapsa dinghuensis]|uniref:Outer membrane lipoprotein-sorting protein n=1 Tax=Acidicapsa dinghuensis TaxID=2218256 RepID=A0ABW1EI90_9BACT|nr:hypothetical protein [Acidicapsa dinghuensis]
MLTKTFCRAWLRRSIRIALVCALMAGCAVSWAKDKKKRDPNATVSYSPMPLDSGYGPMDLTPPSISPEEIVKKFTAKESEFREAMNHYTYRRAVKVQTIDDDGKVDGEYFEVDDIIFTPDGRRTEHVVDAPPNTLQRIAMSPADFQDIEQRLPFVLTTQDASQYDIKYVGKQKVDQVECYVFDVSPKVIEKGKRYFQGKIWVDTEELQIVITNGKNVPDDLRKGHEDLSTPFTTYREEIDGKNWFPTYTKGDGVLHFTAGNGYLSDDVHVRQTVKYTDYKQFGSTSTILYNGTEITNSPDNTKKPDSQPK